jgi:hypothetical protein
VQRGCFGVYLLVGCFFLTTSAATAQEVVHALCGTIRSINSTDKTITISTGTGNGTPKLFNEVTKSNVALDFDKRIRAEATTADTFTKSGVRVIVYYFWDGNLQTAVAFQDLGPGPFEESNGTVVRFDKHTRVLTLKKKSGSEESFHLSQKTVAETPYGAVEALELDAKDGDQMQVTASSVDGNDTALFIRAG